MSVMRTPNACALVATAAVLSLSCDPQAVGRSADDNAHFVPPGITVMALAGGNGVLDVIALTLERGRHGDIELYAAVRNDGNIAACSAALSVEIFDAAGDSLAAGIGGLLTQHFYRRADDPDTIAACLGPGDVSMTALTDLPADLATEEVATIVYRCPYFALPVVPIDGLRIRDLTSVPSGTQTTYRGTLDNGLDVMVNNPSVTLFPVNRVGRPLGMMASRSSVALQAGDSWAFEVEGESVPTTSYVVYPAGALAR